MIRYQLKDREIYYEAFRVISVGPIVEEKKAQHTELGLVGTAREGAYIERGLEHTKYEPWRTITLEGGQEVSTLNIELPDVKVGDHMIFDINYGDYRLFNEDEFKNNPKLIKAEDQTIRERLTRTSVWVMPDAEILTHIIDYCY